MSQETGCVEPGAEVGEADVVVDGLSEVTGGAMEDTGGVLAAVVGAITTRLGWKLWRMIRFFTEPSTKMLIVVSLRGTVRDMAASAVPHASMSTANVAPASGILIWTVPATRAEL